MSFRSLVSCHAAGPRTAVLYVGLGLAGLAPFAWATPPTDAPFVGSAACAECHAEAYDTWRESHHGWAWREPTAENVLGDFDGATFEHQGRTSRFLTRDGRYQVETADSAGRLRTWDIAGTVGVEPLQQYLVELDDGRLQALDMAWDTEGRRWYHLYPEQDLRDDPGLHWSGPYKNWNSRCVSCHVTDFKKAYDPQSNRYASTWTEKGVGCEACHGPGGEHVDWARTRPSAPTADEPSQDPRLAVRFDGSDRQAELQVCAGCHSRRESLGADSPPPGEPFADHFRLTPLRQDLYHADGQIKGEVYVYGSFLQTKKHAAGVSCSDCHTPHGAELVLEGNAVCTQCHNPAGRNEFPSLPKAFYDTPAHHRHAQGSVGAACVSCHMPATTYMGVDPRRDHSFRVPRPDLTVKIGTPNACTDCHEAEGAAWARDQVAAWYPDGRSGEPHFAEVIDAARRGLDPQLAGDLLALAVDTSVPGLVRATATEMLAPVVTPQIAGGALPLLQDADPSVRVAGLTLFHSAPPAARTRHAGPLLEDPTRVVRVEAAQRILDVSTAALRPEDRAVVEAAVDEYRASLAAQADFPEVQLNLARVATRLGRPQTARRSLEAALALDPKAVEAWLRLVELDVAGERFDDAARTLARATDEVRYSGALYQWLGRVEAQAGRLDSAVLAFETALSLLPGEIEARFEYVSLLTELGRFQSALEALTELDEETRLTPRALYLAAVVHAKAHEPERAHRFADLLAARHPEHPLLEPLSRLLTGNQ